ncbi:hypothetical protein PMAYCL1PPCAC_29737 [Pristionchus mayeri]|uniref:Uncharacterized protein n=1 Tax=Pristionchus mayeri TaxID=1317129 RepID=A0AAN5DCA7_9BILA|nr:hypothetical protein PMAYCL1PPCAC_29737 [Pristionchus mayeri]
MASSAFIAFILVPLILIAISLYAYRILQRQRRRREMSVSSNGQVNVAPLPSSSLHSSPLPILEASALPYSPQSVFAPPTLSFPSPSSPPPYPSLPLPSPPITPSISIPNVPLPPYTDTMDSVDLHDDPPPAYEEISQKIEKKM